MRSQRPQRYRLPMAVLDTAKARLAELGREMATRIMPGLGRGIDADGFAADAAFARRRLTA